MELHKCTCTYILYYIDDSNLLRRSLYVIKTSNLKTLYVKSFRVDQNIIFLKSVHYKKIKFLLFDRFTIYKHSKVIMLF